MAEPAPFDLLGPLPTGTTVLEASAGTGKTHALAVLATRYVAEGVDLSRLLLVTFGRAATQELRERTRQRLRATALALGAPEDHPDDPLVQHLARTDRAVAQRNLVRAVSDFDAATITTTHGFCQRMLDGLGIAGDRDPGTQLVEQVDDLLREVVDDLYLRAFARDDAPVPRLKPAEALQVARAATADRSARLEPADAAGTTGAGQRVALARAARAELSRRKRAAGVRDFDDLLVLLRDALADPEQGADACRRVRDRYDVVLVDEFQDTDPVQWEVLRLAFHGSRTLVLVGDPKQAIYAFRGAEVLSYLDAVEVADRVATLDTNWRSDAGLLRGLQHLHGGAALGHPRIVAQPVRPTRDGRLPGTAPLRLRVLRRDPPLLRGGFPAVDDLRCRVAADVADEVVRLLDGGLRLQGGALAPGDVAVLVRTRKQAGFVREALDRARVPSVLAGSTSVFETAAAVDWLRVLEAVEQPHRAGRVRLAALTPLLGWTATRLAGAGDEEVAGLAEQLRGWAALFAEAGFAALVERLTAQTRLAERMLGQEAGGRRLTDLRHVAQVLDRAAVEEGLGVTALTGWLAERVRDPASASGADRSRRLDSDAAAVQVLTLHTSKGLEFPVVLLPYGWDAARASTPATMALHDADGTRVLDVGGKDGPGYASRLAVRDEEEGGEDLRLLYVGATRAACALVAWWAPARDTTRSPLHRLLLGREDGRPEPAATVPVPDDDALLDRLRAWAAPAGADVAVEPAGPAQGLQWAPAPAAPQALAAAPAPRVPDATWRRTSYSALTAAAHEVPPGVGSEAEEPGRADEPAEEPPVDLALDGPPSTLEGLPGGAAFGTLVHSVLEQVDTAVPDLAAELRARCAHVVAAHLSDVDPAALAGALLPVLQTPLGHGTLATVHPRDRLAELDFELPLGGGDAPAGDDVTLAAVARLLRAHLPADDVLAGYPDLLEGVEAPPLRGYLSGSIDAVLRRPDGLWVVVDYKTNRLARGPLTALHYTREAMAAEMLRAHYPLQALLYGVALHRYLRWRAPGAPARIAVQYLFVRGMVGPATPPGCGVFDWEPPPALLPALSDLLS